MSGELLRLRTVESELTSALAAAEAAVEWHQRRAAAAAKDTEAEVAAAKAEAKDEALQIAA